MLSVKQNKTNTNVRFYKFEIKSNYAPLTKDLPQSTKIYHEWPLRKLRVDLPKYLRIASIHNAQGGTPTLIGPPIHVQAGDKLKVEVENSLINTGISIHWHGFELKNSWEYDGVAGITQCPISPSGTFTYEFDVNEVPGTYWYHTHSGSLGVNAFDAIHGPLVVHPRGSTHQKLVESLNSIVENKLSYQNERILFFSDGFLHSDSHHLLIKMGGLNAPVSLNADGFIVGSSAWEFGTCNGKLREIINVLPGETYKFRLINGGKLFALRIDFGLKMKVIAADSEPVVPLEVDQVILHTAERFDVEITIPANFSIGETFWIKADTLESLQQGYQNGIRAILHINKDPFMGNVPDPVAPIEALQNENEKITLNCYSQEETDSATNEGGCLPVTTLNYNGTNTFDHSHSNFEFHTVDFEFSPNPQYAHFIRIDDGFWLQHRNPMHSMIDPKFDANQHMHPNTAMLNVASNKSAIIILRNGSTMDHPIHLHGIKMEILDIISVQRQKSCSVAKCNLDDFYNSPERLNALAEHPYGRAILKDTVILPAGGIVAVRIHSGYPALWFAHCHLHVHREDGMAFILNVGNYTAPKNNSWLKNFPQCDTPYLESFKMDVACNCFINKDALLGTTLSDKYKCSGEALCFHEVGSLANISPLFPTGISIRSQYKTPSWVISTITSIVMIIISFAIICVRKYFKKGTKDRKELIREFSSKNELLSNDKKKDITDNTEKTLPKSSVLVDDGDNQQTQNTQLVEGTNTNTCASNDSEAIDKLVDIVPDATSSMFNQFKCNFIIQWNSYVPTSVNFFRFVEQILLGFLTGIVFYNVGNDTTATGLAQVNSLLFFSVTLWTFTRMYHALQTYHEWRDECRSILSKREGHYIPLYFSLFFPVVISEFWWPYIFCLVCFTMGGIFGNIQTFLVLSSLLCMNNMCYIALCSAIGVLCNVRHVGFILATIVSQTSLIVAGFYTELPRAINWSRYISPVFWTYKGMAKVAYHWSNSFTCVKGQTEVGPNQCLLEFHPMIDQMKTRGINTATFNDPNSDKFTFELIMLLVLFLVFQFVIFVRLYFLSRKICK